MCRRKIISERGKEPVQGGTRAISTDAHTHGVHNKVTSAACLWQ